MKRNLFLAVAILLVCTPLVRAQSNVKVDVEDFKSKIAKSDADIAHPKKGVKSGTWMDRGALFLNIAEAPSFGAYSGMDEKAATVMFGPKPVSPAKTEKIGETSYRVVKYTNLTLYMTKDQEGVNRVQFWSPNIVITENPLDRSLEAYMKAYELDNSTSAKVTKAQEQIANNFKQIAGNSFSLQKYEDAARAFAGSYNALIAPPASIVDTMSVFNAGFLFTVAQKFEEGAKYLNKALEYGYESDGDTFFYLYHCYHGLNQIDKAKDVLLKGLAKFPENSKIVEGLLAVYTSGEGNPEDIIPIVRKAIESDPKNPSLYSGLGLIYDKLGDMDNAIEAFAKAAELMPNDYSVNFNLGLLSIKKGDAMNTELSNKVFQTSEEYEAELSKVNKAYALALEPLERALAQRSNDPSTIELLKNLSFRLRDEPGMQERYNKYDEMFKALSQ